MAKTRFQKKLCRRNEIVQVIKTPLYSQSIAFFFKLLAITIYELNFWNISVCEFVFFYNLNYIC